MFSTYFIILHSKLTFGTLSLKLPHQTLMKAKEAASQVFLEEKCCHPYFVDNMCIILQLRTSVSYLLNLILRKSTICLENIDSNKIRGEGVYNDPAPLRSAGSYFYIPQLFSTEPDGCAHCVVHILISGQSGWRRSRETVASSKYH